MSIALLKAPIDAKEFQDFIELFKLKEEIKNYRDKVLENMIKEWGEDLSEEQRGYIDATIDVVKDGKLVTSFEHINSEELKNYLSEKVGDFSLYAKLWHTSTPSEYRIDVPYNIGTQANDFWVDLSLIFDGRFNLQQANLAYDTESPYSKYLTYWIMKCSI